MADDSPKLPSRAQLTAASSPPPPQATSASESSEKKKKQEPPARHPSNMTLNSDAKPMDDLLPLERVDAFLTKPGGPLEIQYELLDGRIQPIFEAQRTTLRTLILGSMQSYSRRTHIVYGNVRLTYADTYKQATNLANALRIEYGVRKGDRIAVISRNTPHFALTVFAAYILGAIIVPINAFAEAPTLHFCIQDADARVVIVDVERWHRIHDSADGGGLAKLVKNSKSLQSIVVSPWKLDTYVPRSERDWLREDAATAAGGSLTITDWDDIAQRATTYPNLPLVKLSPEDYAMIMYTSGTTGLPKGVLSKHRQVLGPLGVAGVHVARAFIRRGQAPPTPVDADAWEEHLCPSILTLSPLFHVTGLSSGLISISLRGGKIVLLPSYSPQRALEVIRTEGIKGISGVGFMVREILKLAQPGDLVSLESATHGGASAANEIPDEMQKKKRGLSPSTGYGMTETNAIVLGAFLDEYIADPSTIGHPVPSVVVRIIDPETGRVVPDGQPGELLISSPCNATGYWRRPKETAETFLADGYVRTGDLARRGPNGYIYIMDRIKDMIIRGGENVSCSSVEGAIYSDARVSECAAVGLPDERLGERVGMIVVTHPSSSGSTLDTKAIQEIARAKGLPKFAIPEVVWVRTEPLGKNASGKVVKRELKEEMKKWLAAGGRESKL